MTPFRFAIPLFIAIAVSGCGKKPALTRQDVEDCKRETGYKPVSEVKAPFYAIVLQGLEESRAPNGAYPEKLDDLWPDKTRTESLDFQIRELQYATDSSRQSFRIDGKDRKELEGIVREWHEHGTDSAKAVSKRQSECLERKRKANAGK